MTELIKLIVICHLSFVITKLSLINPISKQHRTNGLLTKTINTRNSVNRFLRSHAPNPLLYERKGITLLRNEKSVAGMNVIPFIFFTL